MAVCTLNSHYSHTFSKKDIKMANIHTKRCPASPVLGKMKIKATGHHFTPTAEATITRTDGNNYSQECREMRTLHSWVTELRELKIYVQTKCCT